MEVQARGLNNEPLNSKTGQKQKLPAQTGRRRRLHWIVAPVLIHSRGDTTGLIGLGRIIKAPALLE